MLLNSHDENTSVDECLLIVSESGMRYLWLLANNIRDTQEFVWLANALDYHNVGIADMHILGLIEVGEGCSEDQTKPDHYVIEQKGREHIKYAVSQGVCFERLAVDTSKFQ